MVQPGAMKEVGAVLLDESDRQAAGLQQTKHVGRGRGGDRALVRYDVVLGAVAGSDVVLGDHATRPGLPLTRRIFLVLPSLTRAPSGCLVEVWMFTAVSNPFGNP